MKQDIVHFLQNHPPFKFLTLEDIQRIIPDIQTHQIAAGQDILTYGGTPSEHLYIICHGRVDLLREADQSNITVFDTLGEGDTFGHLSLIRGKAPELTVRSHEATLLYMLPAATFFRLRCHNLAFSQFVDNSAFDRLLLLSHTRDTSDFPEFRVRLRDILQRSLVCVSPDLNVREAARLMHRNNVRYIIIETDPPGIVTDHDLRNRVLVEGRSYDTPVGDIMTSPILTLPADSLVIEGLMVLLETRIRHLPVTEDNRVIGVITHTDILREQSHNPLFLPRRLLRARTIEDLRHYAEQVTHSVGGLLHTGARVQDIGRMVAVSHSALLEHLLRQAELALGPPPCPYAWMVLGSEGRYEQTLRTDQDNAIVYHDDAPPEAEPYFAQMAERVVEQLVACGFPRCPGDIMATNPRWRQPLHVWKQYFQDWITIPDEEALMRVSIFFDYRRVHGPLNVEQALRPIIQKASKNSIFLARLCKNALRQSPPLGGFFRGLVVEHDTEGRDVIDLKTRGTALIVDLARLFALEAACAETNTITRLRLSAPRSDLSDTGANQLEAAFEYISMLRLRHQYAQYERGETPTNHLQISKLSTIERRELKESFRAIESIQRSANSLFGAAWMS
jgi:CBS domain-containing protein